jgi:hypothetical protein
MLVEDFADFLFPNAPGTGDPQPANVSIQATWPCNK